ncbi:SDR family oxidoreductase [Thalassospiraceae bacterium LMO-SO8]|nr:SDR family oxidoreductase [Alphaproteobacteria bacterium LMO-S08]WND77667.1 SDR family oxidoreductase [Thalassospiraceae bacterium LMO-SO8]
MPMRKPAVLVAGQSSFLARHFIAAASDRLSVTGIDRIDTTSLGDATFDVAVNFACEPGYYTNEYAAAVDLDRILADGLRGRIGHYVMLSSRVVYGRTERLCISETSMTDPQSPYARNKSETERRLLDDPSLTVSILRLANVFGQEQGRRTFSGQALASLRRAGQVVLDISPDTRRDFLPVGDFARILVMIAAQPPGGILNVGSGVPTRVGDMADWFVAGYGSGRVTTTGDRRKDEFCLDIARLAKIVGDVTSPGRIKGAAIEAGRGLRHA